MLCLAIANALPPIVLRYPGVPSGSYVLLAASICLSLAWVCAWNKCLQYTLFFFCINNLKHINDRPKKESNRLRDPRLLLLNQNATLIELIIKFILVLFLLEIFGNKIQNTPTKTRVRT